MTAPWVQGAMTGYVGVPTGCASCEVAADLIEAHGRFVL